MNPGRPTTPNEIVTQCHVSWVVFPDGRQYAFDTVDLDRVLAHRWYPGAADGRLVTHRGELRHTLYLSRYLVGAGPQQRVFYRDGDIFNLRSQNLFVVDQKPRRKNISRLDTVTGQI